MEIWETDIVAHFRDTYIEVMIILALLYPTEDHVFSVWYQGKSYPYQSFERMMDILVECGHINRRYADSLKKKYENINAKEI